MAGSLDELIDFLLEEIALGGESGLTFQQYAGLVQQFYRPSQSGQERNTIDGTVESPNQDNVDWLLLTKTWKWLARHSDVSIGKDREYNDENLDELTKLFPGFTTLSWSNDGAPLQLEDEEPTLSSTVESSKKSPHLYVNEERISIAICGHPPDAARVFPSEWVLLQIIAASRTEGIMQGDLVRISKQDKRSVPKRTDVLHEKGYIVKRIMFVKGNKTSRLYLRRFTDQKAGDKPVTDVVDQLTVAHTARQLFDLLRNTPLLPVDDLSDALGMKRPGRARILAQLIRSFGKLGCLKRVKTAFGPSAQTKDLSLCVQLLREPQDDDWHTSSMQDIDLNQSVEILASLYEAEAEQLNATRTEDDTLLDSNEPIGDLDADDDMTGKPRQNVPQWNPDRVLANVFFQVAQQKGLGGMSNGDIRNALTGPFIKRILESLLVRVSYRSLLAQPKSLQHLAIIRTQQYPNGIMHYIHYTFDAFVDRVKTGEGKLEDMLGGEPYVKELKKAGKDGLRHVPNLELDAFGFTKRNKPDLQMNDGEASMSQLLRDARANGIESRLGDLFLKDVGNGRLDVFYRDRPEATPKLVSGQRQPRLRRLGRPPKRVSIPQNETSAEVVANPQVEPRESTPDETSEAFEPTPKNANTSGQVVRGRPRKFTRGTERYWRDVFPLFIKEKDPSYDTKTSKAGLMTNPIALKVFNGRPSGFDETILEAMDLNLPVAAKSHDVSLDWMNKTKAIMYRSKVGLYITPAGYQAQTRGRTAQIFILRSTRLAELDWCNRKRSWSWQNISSSASHSFRYQRYHPILDFATREITVTPSQVVESASATQQESYMASTPPETKADDSQILRVGDPTHATEIDWEVWFTSRSIEMDVTGTAESEERAVDTNEAIDVRQNFEGTAEIQNTKAPADSRSQSKAGRKRAKGPEPRAILTRSNRRRRPTRKAAENVSPSVVVSSNAEEPAESPQHRENLPQEGGDNNMSLLETRDEESFPQQTTTVSTSELNPIVNKVNRINEQEEVDRTSGGSVTKEADTETHLVEPQSSVTEDPDHSTPSVLLDAVVLKSRTVDDPSYDDRPAVLSNPANNDDESPVETLISQELDISTTNRGDTIDHELPIPEAVPTQEVHSEVQLEEIADQATNQVLAEATPKSRKRTRDVSEDSPYRDEAGGQTVSTPAGKRSKQDGKHEIKRADVSRLCRLLVLELIGMCSGLAPNVPWTFRRAMVPRWQEAGVTMDQLSAKNVRAAIKALCDSGKLKQITFAFRGKSGTMIRMSVIALSGMDAQNPAVLDMQKKMRELEPADYVPPDLLAESLRNPNKLNIMRYKKELRLNEPSEPIAEDLSTSRSLRKPRGNDRRHSITIDANSSTLLPQQEPAFNASGSPVPLEGLESETEPASSVNTGFLTIKVPQIQRLGLPAARSPKYAPPSASLAGPELAPVSDQSATGATVSTVNRRTRTRQKDLIQPGPEDHRVIWKNPRMVTLPSSIEDVPNIQFSRDKAARTTNKTAAFARFVAEVDCVAAWEASLPNLIKARGGPLVFINHVVGDNTQDSDRHREDTPIEIDFHVDESSKEVVPEPLEFEPRQDLPLDPPPHGSSSLQPHLDIVPRQKRKASKRKVHEDLDPEDEDYVLPASKKRKQNKEKQRPRRSATTTLDLDTDNPDVAKPKYTRITHLLRTMSEEVKYQIVVAVVVVRTLVGGIEKFIDWRIVCRLVTSYEAQSIKDAWKTMTNRYRHDVAGLTEGLQFRYIDALNDGQVPTVNFDDVYATDWEGIYEWALTHLEKSFVKQAEELPSARTLLFRRHDYSFDESRAVRELFCYNAPQTIPRKEEILSGAVFSKPLRLNSASTTALIPKPPVEEEEADIELSRARSWVMATMLAPEGSLDIDKAQTKLLTLASTSQQVETLLERSIKSLQRDKVVSRSKRMMPMGSSGRGRYQDPQNQEFNHMRHYEASARFFEHFDFRRLVTTTMLKRAAKYKVEVLDPIFRQQGASMTVAKDTALNDGDMVAILNLVATCQLRVRPGPDVPASLWGLEWQKHGYTTRMIDKRNLGFSIILSTGARQGNEYVSGDPLSTTRTSTIVPRGEVDAPDGQGRIPMWFDITHTFQPSIWEMVLGAIVGLVSTRPGIDAREIARMLWYGISVWEVGLVLRWTEKVGVTRRTTMTVATNNTGDAGDEDLTDVRWETREWWWMVMGTSGHGESGDETQGQRERAWRIE